MEFQFVRNATSAGKYAGKALQFIIRRFLHVLFFLCAVVALVLAYLLGRSIAFGQIGFVVIYAVLIAVLCIIRWSDTYISKLRFKKKPGVDEPLQTTYIFYRRRFVIVKPRSERSVYYRTITRVLDAPYSILLFQGWRLAGSISKVYDSGTEPFEALLEFLKDRCSKAKFSNTSRFKLRKIRHVAYFILLGLVFLSSMLSGMQQAAQVQFTLQDYPSHPSTPLYADPDGYVRVTLPEDLLGSTTMTEALDSILHALPEVLTKGKFTTYIDEHGRLTFVLTQAQFVEYREALYRAGQDLKALSTALVEIAYQDEWMCEITVSVERTAYEQNPLLQLAANQVLANIAGMYQIFSGFGMDEWHCAITVADAETGEVLSARFYPDQDTWSILPEEAARAVSP